MKKCPNCGCMDLESFYSVQDVPVNSCLMLDSPQDAIKYPTGNINLCFCNHCSFIFNSRYLEYLIEYSTRYEDQQGYSTTFNAFQYALIEELVTTYKLHYKTILEIGCGKGDFLKLICQMGNNKGIGIDPAINTERFTNGDQIDIDLYPECYSQKHASLRPDFICCRHTLEHIQNTRGFVKTIRNALDNQSNIMIFIEVPDTTRVLKNICFQDIYYEHCSYFLPGSLAYLFESCGFQIEDIRQVYDRQYLLLFATANSKNQLHTDKIQIQQIKELVNNFSIKVHEKILYWKETISNYQHRNKNIVIWGSGSKCVAFINALNMNMNNVEIVDINPHKQGKFMPGIARQIKSPESIDMRGIDLIVIMNKIYEQEIREGTGKNSSNIDFLALD